MDNSEVDVEVVRDDGAFAEFCRVRTEAHERPAEVAGTSHRNLQREGLGGGFTKLVVRVAGP